MEIGVERGFRARWCGGEGVEAGVMKPGSAGFQPAFFSIHGINAVCFLGKSVMKKICLMLALSTLVSGATCAALADGKADGTEVDGSNVQQFLDSGPDIDTQAMERASIPADKAISMPERSLFLNDKPPSANGTPQKRTGFFSRIGDGVSGALNWMGFPVGQDTDIDSSLAADLPVDYGTKPPKQKKKKRKVHETDASTTQNQAATNGQPTPQTP